MSNKAENYQQGLKYPIVKASFDMEVAKFNYQQLLQNLASITVTRDNINEDLTKDGREILKRLDDKKDNESKEPLQWHRDIMEAYRSLKTPIEEQIRRIQGEIKTVATQINTEKSAVLAEQTRIATAKAAIPAFTNKVANLIALATTDNDVVTIEKMIGSEKTKKSVYQEFLPELITHCDGLRPQIKELKETIRALEIIKKQEQDAILNGDDEKMVQAKEKKEYLTALVQETGIRIHETAYEQATNVEIAVPDVVDTAPKGRSYWRWRVDDIKMLQKKNPNLVKLVPDEEAIELLLSIKKTDGSLKNKTEEKMNGLTFFIEKTYK